MLSLRGEAEAISFYRGLPRTLRVLAMTDKSVNLIFYWQISMKMIKRIFFILLSLIFLQGVTEAQQKVVVVQGLKTKPYEEALRGFQSACNVETKEIVISEQEEAEIVRKIRRIKPDMILAVGVEALSKVKKIKDIPIVYLMVLNPTSPISKQENITGVSMNIPPEKQLSLLQDVLYEAKRVGLLYDPAKTGSFVEKARYSSEKLGIKLVVKEVYNPKDVPSMLDSMKNGIDVFWMLPDTTVITPETVEFLFLFSLENKIPVLTFSDKYLEMGAMMSVGIDTFDIGKQAGEMAKEILSGMNIKNISRVDARKTVFTFNLKIAKKLGITIKNEINSKARIKD